jgi:phospholipid/cholesterol/gamma-HCH transport system ATP-binding protein
MIKRAALARAIITKPEILLCDEPFSGLDPISVKRIEALLRRINRQLQITMLLSSHHIPSTMRMADQVLLLLSDAAVAGPPQELKQSPDPHIAGFLSEEADESFDTTESPHVRAPHPATN